ncbi:MAG: hypothetical protein JWN44_3030 [Myxococcales bacterium]|nr:hypothetical protein [Myxococcales bacterium]
MTTQLKQISRAAIPAALAKAEKYRLLNEPEQAESICRDVLAVDERNQPALVTLVLSLTDQFRASSNTAVREAETALAAVEGAYERLYYAGIIRERWAKALLVSGDPGHQAYDWMHDAMRLYEQADPLEPAGSDDAILRWNSCARVIAKERLSAGPEHAGLDGGDDAPSR